MWGEVEVAKFTIRKVIRICPSSVVSLASSIVTNLVRVEYSIAFEQLDGHNVKSLAAIFCWIDRVWNLANQLSIPL